MRRNRHRIANGRNGVAAKRAAHLSRIGSASGVPTSVRTSIAAAQTLGWCSCSINSQSRRVASEAFMLRASSVASRRTSESPSFNSGVHEWRNSLGQRLQRLDRCSAQPGILRPKIWQYGPRCWPHCRCGSAPSSWLRARAGRARGREPRQAPALHPPDPQARGPPSSGCPHRDCPARLAARLKSRRLSRPFCL